MIRYIISAFLLVFVFSGCISLTKELPAYTTYTFKPIKDTTALQKVNASLMVMEPKSLNSINSLAISYAKEPFLEEKYVLSQWSNKPSKLIQEAIASYLIQKNSFSFITTHDFKIKTNYTLLSHIENLQHTFNEQNSYAEFSIRVYLKNNQTNNIFFQTFTYNKKSLTSDANGFIIALNEIMNLFLLDLNNFVITNIKKDIN